VGGRKGKARRGTSWEGIRAAALALPGVTEGRCYGTPALYVRKRLMARLKEDGETIALRVDRTDREILLQLDPRAFFLTEHYRAHPWILVRLAEAQPALLGKLLDDAWRRQAAKSAVALREASDPTPIAIPRVASGSAARRRAVPGKEDPRRRGGAT